MPFDAERVSEILNAAQAEQGGFDLIAPDANGFMVMATVPSHFNRDHKLALELAWGSRTPGGSRELIEAARTKAGERGARALIVGAEIDNHGAALGRLYRQLGGVPHGLSYRFTV